MLKNPVPLWSLIGLMLLSGCAGAIDLRSSSPMPEISGATQPVPLERYRHLSRGVNLAFWFWLPQTGGDDIQSRFSDTDFHYLMETGFTFVRLPIDLSYLLDEDDPEMINSVSLAELDTAIDRLLAAGLAVVVDIHTTASPRMTLRYFQAGWKTARISCQPF